MLGQHEGHDGLRLAAWDGGTVTIRPHGEGMGPNEGELSEGSFGRLPLSNTATSLNGGGGGLGGFGMTRRSVAICSCRRLLACRHSPLSLPLHPLPPQAAAPIGLSPPRALPPPRPPYPHLPTHRSLPSGGRANGAPGPSLCHCPVSGPHGGGRRPSPLAMGGGGGGIGGWGGVQQCPRHGSVDVHATGSSQWPSEDDAPA